MYILYKYNSSITLSFIWNITDLKTFWSKGMVYADRADLLLAPSSKIKQA